MEIIDVVDANDVVIASEEKSAAIKKGLTTRTSFIILLNSKNELYLQQRKSTKKTYPLYWSGSAAGHVRSGESYLEAAKRELEEELGVTTELHEINKRFSVVDKEFTTYFVGKHEGPFRLEEAAIENAAFFTLEQLRINEVTMKMTSYLIAALPMVEKYLSSKSGNV